MSGSGSGNGSVSGGGSGTGSGSGNGEGEGEEIRMKTSEEKFRKVLVETIIRWGSEASIENTDLVREMFSLLLRQYDTVGELMRATENTYVIDSK